MNVIFAINLGLYWEKIIKWISFKTFMEQTLGNYFKLLLKHWSSLHEYIWIMNGSYKLLVLSDLQISFQSYYRFHCKNSDFCIPFTDSQNFILATLITSIMGFCESWIFSRWLPLFSLLKPHILLQLSETPYGCTLT